MSDITAGLLYGYAMGYGIAVGITWSLLLHWWRA